MIDPLKSEQLVERIRLAARQAGAGFSRVTAETIARGELPPVPEGLPLPALPVRPPSESGNPGAPGFPLDEAASLLPRARKKITVSESAPGLLRPLLRNQGGFNHILLEALERLVEVNRQLQHQNQELHGRLVAMQGWMNTAARTSALDHDWMLAVENRLRGLPPERLAQWEERLERLEAAQGTGEGLPDPAHGEGLVPPSAI